MKTTDTKRGILRSERKLAVIAIAIARITVPGIKTLPISLHYLIHCGFNKKPSKFRIKSKPLVIKDRNYLPPEIQYNTEDQRGTELTTQPDPCKAAPSAFIFSINFSSEPNCSRISSPNAP